MTEVEPNSNLIVMTANLPVSYIERIDKLIINKSEKIQLKKQNNNKDIDVMEGLYPSRSEFIRQAIRNMLLEIVLSLKQSIPEMQEMFISESSTLVAKDNEVIIHNPDGTILKYNIKKK